MKKMHICSEAAYAAAILLLSLAVAMMAAAGFGVSMVAAPAYIISQKAGILTFGQCEYVVQGALFVVFCILMRRVKPVYFSAFLTGVLYGAVLDLWRLALPHFNPAVTTPGTLPLIVRLTYFAAGMVLTAFSVALFFRTYLYPQVYDFFVKGVSGKFGLNRSRFKIAFDAACLAASCVLTLLLFGTFVGIGVGTLVMTCCNGLLIGFFGKLLDRYFAFEPLFKKFADYFELE